MYHSSGNYEAFVHPRKPEGVENKSAYIVGTGLAGLSAAIFLVRDAQMPGENIHILEVSPVAGGALDGAYIEGHGYCCRGGRELEAHMECLRFAHHTSDIGGAGAFSDMLFIKYNQYESFVLPILSCLEDHGVKVTYNTTVTDIRFDCKDGKKTATQITTLRDGKEEPIALTENDFIFTTLGSNVENSTIGSHHTAPKLKLENGAGKSWALWKKIAAQSDDFGHPDKFCGKVQESMFASATMDIGDAIAPYVEKISQHPLGGGRTGTGGIVSV